jgi:hypothetical protein
MEVRMATRNTQPTVVEQAAQAERDPDTWKSGDEPLTPSQASYLKTLADDAHEAVDQERLTKAEASKKIDELKERTGRG